MAIPAYFWARPMTHSCAAEKHKPLERIALRDENIIASNNWGER